MNEYDNNIDDGVDTEIATCFDFENPKSFFLFAGAGSGKTRSLVNALKYIEKEHGDYLRLRRQRVATITYTNAACDEIIHRLENNPLFFVHTIHSFAWELIKSYRQDIKDWLRSNIQNEIKTLEEKQVKGRIGTDAALKREKKIERNKERLQYLKYIRKFVYNPNGDNLTKDSLNHAEVIKICSSFLTKKETMRKILIGKFPILLIDESQDTNKDLIEAFFHVEGNNKGSFSLGLFGDTMQRIYADGKKKLGRDLPDDWITPAKKMNHRCPKRIIRLINKIRESVDGQEQLPRVDQKEGFVRLFIVPSDSQNKKGIEEEISSRMAKITGDDLWEEKESIKVLTLEHHMAASRMNFLNLFEPLYKVNAFRTSLLDGTHSELRFFTQIILPLIVAKKAGDEFKVATVVKKYSPILDRKNLKNSSTQLEKIKEANEAVNKLFSLWSNNHAPSLYQILENLLSSKLFEIPENLIRAFDLLKNEIEGTQPLEAWKVAIHNPFSQVENYYNYISDKSRFGTHQGIKGLQFPRVLVILDDSEAKGFLFSYEKLFNAKDRSSSDIKKEQSGEETSIDRTKRLFYVTCSRTQESLAIVAYTEKCETVKEFVINENWFFEEEIELLGVDD